MLKRLLIGLAALAVGAAACSGSSAPPQQSFDSAALVTWDRSPSTIVFRADLTGGSRDPFLSRSDVPPCTIYGDNHIVWTNELGVNNLQILEDRLTDEQVTNFVSFLAGNMQIYKYQARANLQPPGDISPMVETLTLFVNGVKHETDAFSGWDIDYYQAVLLACRQVSIAPVLYVPQAGWLSVETAAYDSSVLAVPWSAQASGLNLAELAASGQPKWLSDGNVPILWNILLTSSPGVQLLQDNQRYRFALQIPNVTRDSPPAP